MEILTVPTSSTYTPDSTVYSVDSTTALRLTYTENISCFTIYDLHSQYSKQISISSLPNEFNVDTDYTDYASLGYCNNTQYMYNTPSLNGGEYYTDYIIRTDVNSLTSEILTSWSDNNPYPNRANHLNNNLFTISRPDAYWLYDASINQFYDLDAIYANLSASTDFNATILPNTLFIYPNNLTTNSQFFRMGTYNLTTSAYTEIIPTEFITLLQSDSAWYADFGIDIIIVIPLETANSFLITVKYINQRYHDLVHPAFNTNKPQCVFIYNLNSPTDIKYFDPLTVKSSPQIYRAVYNNNTLIFVKWTESGSNGTYVSYAVEGSDTYGVYNSPLAVVDSVYSKLPNTVLDVTKIVDLHNNTLSDYGFMLGDISFKNNEAIATFSVGDNTLTKNTYLKFNDISELLYEYIGIRTKPEHLRGRLLGYF